MRSALLGHTGFVGSNLKSQMDFDHLYNSTNIDKIAGGSFDLVVCAAAPAEKWRANQEPESDLKNVQRLMDCVGQARIGRFVLISTVDVYSSPINVDESSTIIPSDANPYGTHRYLLEQFVRANFPDVNVIRLPGLFGNGLKKNFIYDLVHNNSLDYTHSQGVFQFYNVRNLVRDVQTTLDLGIELVNLSSEPVSATAVAEACDHPGFTNTPARPPARYNMLSMYADLYGGRNGYMYDAQTILDEIRNYYLTTQGDLT